ncbi:hypothetical protein [Chakrabartyella piscis]|uniref:hypothetical protein n=1 Tax=Chakrabartyella piscis TaxID=2918914 RepID=UPI002958B335|nr:hypothetical protein [Chakrabartyella piscis]
MSTYEVLVVMLRQYRITLIAKFTSGFFRHNYQKTQVISEISSSIFGDSDGKINRKGCDRGL